MDMKDEDRIFCSKLFSISSALAGLATVAVSTVDFEKDRATAVPIVIAAFGALSASTATYFLFKAFRKNGVIVHHNPDNPVVDIIRLNDVQRLQRAIQNRINQEVTDIAPPPYPETNMELPQIVISRINHDTYYI